LKNKKKNILPFQAFIKRVVTPSAKKKRGSSIKKKGENRRETIKINYAKGREDS
jgi:hypothetical protein